MCFFQDRGRSCARRSGALRRRPRSRATCLARAAREHHVNFNGRLGEREVGRTEANDEVIRLEEAAQEVAVDALEVGEAHVVTDPQAFDLMEHREA